MSGSNPFVAMGSVAASSARSAAGVSESPAAAAGTSFVFDSDGIRFTMIGVMVAAAIGLVIMHALGFRFQLTVGGRVG